jgi:hypothetical protein
VSSKELIVLKRQGRDGHFPIYSLTIYEDGVILYEGIKNVCTVGKRELRINEDTLNQLVYEFINIYYFALNDKYLNLKSDSCAIVITSIRLDTKSKSITHEHGSNAPKTLSELEDKIDLVVNSRQLTGI